MGVARAQRLSLKNRVLELLEAADFDEALRELGKLPSRRVIGALYADLCLEDPTIKWRSVTAMGVTVAELANEDVEAARIIMRRCMWNLNEESGGIAWGVPESMGEIMALHDGLAEEFAHILVSFIMPEGNYLEYEPLQRGVVWGIGRLAEKRPELVRPAAPYLTPLLSSGDAGIRGLAARALGLIGDKSAGAGLEDLLNDEDKFELYFDRNLVRRKVGDVAKQALVLIKENA